MHRFELVAGHPALDFLNTINDWTAAAPNDYLADAGDVVPFGEQAGLLSRAEARKAGVQVTASEHDKLRALRTLLERALQALLEGRAPRGTDLEALDALRTEVSRASHLERDDIRLTSRVSAERAGAATLRLRLASAALALLESASSIERLKRCPACRWFFIDTSRNGSRRWCSMATCGATAKAHRYYWKDRLPE